MSRPRSARQTGRRRVATRTRASKSGASGRNARSQSCDNHHLYQASVQCVESDIDFIDRVFKRKVGRRCNILREDFCGTAWLSCEWVRRRPEHRAIGVDIHKPTLDWARKHNVPSLGDAADRLTLIQEDVRKVRQPRVDAVMALNFSYFLFKDRDTLRSYFQAVYDSLAPDGVLFTDAFGGTESMSEEVEKRKIDRSVQPDGCEVPKFTYVWEQARFNTVNHDILCHIHFELGKEKKIKKAFTYDWRLWTLPEIQELMGEAGFREVEVYMDGWDDGEEEGDGVFRRRTYFENMAGWVAYIVGVK